MVSSMGQLADRQNALEQWFSTFGIGGRSPTNIYEDISASHFVVQMKINFLI